MRRIGIKAACLLLPLVSLCCSRQPSTSMNPGDAGTASNPAPVLSIPESKVEFHPGVEIRFADVTKQAGIDFTHFDGRTEMEYIVETMGSGIGWLDYDQDGLMD